MVIHGEHLTRLDDGTYKGVIEIGHREIVIIIYPDLNWEISQRSALTGQGIDKSQEVSMNDCLSSISAVVTQLLSQPF